MRPLAAWKSCRRKAPESWLRKWLKSKNKNRERGKEGDRDHNVLVIFSLSFAPTSVQMFTMCSLYSLLLNSLPLVVFALQGQPSHLPLCLSLSLSLALERPRRWFADLHRDICVERVSLDLKHSVGQWADAVLLHCVLRVLYFIKSGVWKTKKEREREVEGGEEERNNEDNLIQNNSTKASR